MTPRRRRLLWVLGILAGVSASGALALNAFRNNVTFYFDPSQVLAGKVRPGESFRLGGLVEKGTLVRTPGTLRVQFVVTDLKHSIPVRYDKVLPDLFREGAGMVAHGHLNAQGVFIADQVLAKHDASYMPPQMARELKRHAAEARAASAAKTASANRLEEAPTLAGGGSPAAGLQEQAGALVDPPGAAHPVPSLSGAP